jgi:hypothetical protein
MRDEEEKARKNARLRARRKVARTDISAEIELLYKPIEEWTDEEISRGRPMDKDGCFRGARPKWLTPTIMAERQRRLRQLTMDDLATFAGDALRTIHSVMMDDRRDDEGKPIVSAGVRVDAAKYLMDQFIGKATATVDINQSNPLADLMAKILVNPDGEASHQVIEGSVVDPSQTEDDYGPQPRQLD